MKLQLLKRSLIVILTLWILCPSQFVSASPYEREVSRIAGLIDAEINPGSVESSLDVYQLARHIVVLSRDYHIDPLLILSVVKVESQFKPNARSHSGAIGLMQVMPIVIRCVGSEVDVSKKVELYDPYKNLRLGVHYLTFLKEKYRNNMQKALSAYNIGPTALDEFISQQQFIPSSYYRRVMQSYKNFQKMALVHPEIT